MTQIKVNPLPVITWHWTGMNDSLLSADLPADAALLLHPLSHIDALSWERDVPWEPAGESAMGEEFALWMQGADSAQLSIPARCQGTDAAVVAADSCGSGRGRLRISAGCSSKCAVVVLLRGGCEQAAETDVSALTIDVSAADDACLSLYVVQMLPAAGVCCIDISLDCRPRANVSLYDLSLGAKSSFIGIRANLLGAQSSFRGQMGYRVHSGEQVDINYIAHHKGAQSQSDLTAWGVLEEDAKKLFRGTIDFPEGCPGSAGAEKENILLLGRRQVNQTIPLILCHEEDVAGDHGATISRLDEQVLFYLASRGIDADLAQEMVAEAYLMTIGSRIPDADAARAAEVRITGKERKEEA